MGYYGYIYIVYMKICQLEQHIPTNATYNNTMAMYTGILKYV